MRFIPFMTTMLLVLAVAACGCRGGHDARLEELDSALWRNPDSVYEAIGGIDTIPLNERDRAFLKLLRTEAADKSNHTDTTSATISALEGYCLDGDRESDLHARVNYILGRIHVERGEYPEALTCFRKALRISKENPDSGLIMRTHAQISSVYVDNKLYRHALVHSHEQERLALNLGDTVATINAGLWIAREYHYLDNPDSVKIVYDKVSPIVKDYRKRGYEIWLATQFASFLMDHEEYEKADSIIKQANIYITELTSSAQKNIINRLNLHFGREEDVGRLSEALLSDIKDPHTLKAAARNLALINLEKGNVGEAIRYADSFFHSLDSITKKDVSKMVAELGALYSFSESEQEKAELEKKNMELGRHKLFLYGVLVVLLLMGIIVWGWIKKKQAEKEAATSKDREEMMEKILRKDENIKQLDITKRDLSRTLEEKDKTIKEKNRIIEEQDKSISKKNSIINKQNDRIKEQESNIATLEKDIYDAKTKIIDNETVLNTLRNQMQTLILQKDNELEQLTNDRDRKAEIISNTLLGCDDEIIADELKNMLINGNISKKAFGKLMLYIEETYPKFYVSMKNLKLDEKNFKDAMLIKIGFSTDECAKAIHIDYYALTNRRKRLTQKYDIKKMEFPSWKDFVLSISEDSFPTLNSTN